MVNLTLMAENDRLNMVVVSTEVIRKWQQYGNNFIVVFPLSGSRNQSETERDVIRTECYFFF